MNIYLVRHAKSKPRDGMKYAEASLVELSDYGLEQAKILAHRMRNFDVEKIISSPLPRTRQTAEAIAQKKIPIEFDERLVEQAPSRMLVGHEFKAAKKKGRENWDFIAEGGESFNQAAGRYIDALKDISRLPHENVCVVSHALIMEAALTKLFNLRHIPIIHEASITLIQTTKKGFKLVYIDRETLPPFKAFKKKVKNMLKSLRLLK